MATAKLSPSQRHAFVQRTLGSEYLGPPEETCHWCGCDPHNEIHLGQPLAPKRPRRPTLAELEFQLADLRVELANANSRLDVAVAGQEALRDALEAVLGLDDPKQHRWPAEQQVLRDAKALVAEMKVKP